MQLAFTSTRVNNSSVVDTQTGAVLYDVQTPTSLGRHTTTVRNVQGEVVGVYERAGLSGTVTVGGAQMDVNSWLPKTRILRVTDRMLHATDGKQYHWTKQGPPHTFKCTDPSTGQIVAEYKRGGGSKLLGTKHNALLNINPEGMHIMECLLLSAIVLEGKLRAATTAAIAASG